MKLALNSLVKGKRVGLRGTRLHIASSLHGSVGLFAVPTLRNEHFPTILEGRHCIHCFASKTVLSGLGRVRIWVKGGIYWSRRHGFFPIFSSTRALCHMSFVASETPGTVSLRRPIDCQGVT